MCNLQKLNQESTENLNRLRVSKKIDLVIKHHATKKKSQKWMALLPDSIKLLKDNGKKNPLDITK